MEKLNFPVYIFKEKIIEQQSYIFDSLRKKYVRATPEEIVRQNMTTYLILEKKYPATRMANEIPLTYNGLKKRCDTIVYDKQCRPLVIIEYKNPSIEITQKTFDQVAVYNKTFKVPFMLLSNGITHFFCRILYKQQKYDFFESIPDYEQLILFKQV